ncbi:MAG: carboxypeptidase-like regulatory domain-containing protein [Isosphaeraceae bacterium]|nr:carboxypeptidase-like regulatory domain-containing protein [Isosphaeraceae bacterium]
MRFFPCFLSILMAISLALGGCGSGDETATTTLVPVNGTVTLAGKPLEGALVSFVPEPSNENSTPGADATDPDGNYTAMFRGRAGLAPGKYRILISKTLLPPAVTAASGEDPYMSQLSPPKADRKATPQQVEGVFDREIPDSGATLDFDVKGKEAPGRSARKR